MSAEGKGEGKEQERKSRAKARRGREDTSGGRRGNDMRHRGRLCNGKGDIRSSSRCCNVTGAKEERGEQLLWDR